MFWFLWASLFSNINFKWSNLSSYLTWRWVLKRSSSHFTSPFPPFCQWYICPSIRPAGKHSSVPAFLEGESSDCQVSSKSSRAASLNHPDLIGKVAVINNLLSFAGKDKSKGDSYKHIFAKEWIQTSGYEPLHAAALHNILLLTSSIQSPSAVSIVQLNWPTDLVSHTQLP